MLFTYNIFALETHFNTYVKIVTPTSTSVSPKPGGAWVTPGHSPYTPQQQQKLHPGKKIKWMNSYPFVSLKHYNIAL